MPAKKKEEGESPAKEQAPAKPAVKKAAPPASQKAPVKVKAIAKPAPAAKVVPKPEKAEQPTPAPKAEQPSAAEKAPATPAPRAKPAKKEKATAPKKEGKEEAPEIVEEEEEAGKYVPKAKPDMTPELRQSLKLRQSMSKHRPAFHRQEWFRHQRLGDKWRRPKGIHSKMRRHLGYRPPVVSIGYRGPALSRGLHPSGFAEVLVHNPAELERIDPKKQAARIAHGVGTFKSMHIIVKADELGIRILNVGKERHAEMLKMAEEFKGKQPRPAKKEVAK